MKKIRRILQSEAIRIVMKTLSAVGGGFLLSIGTVSGVASPLAAAFAGISHPLYAFSLLLGSLIAYTVSGAPQGMQYLIGSLVVITCCRILFHDTDRPHILSLMTALCCIVAGAVIDIVFYAGGGKLPLYILEALLTGVASYFLADAALCLRTRRPISMHAGRSFTFAFSYLLCITALCGVDASFCNLGRVAGTAATLLCARKLRQQGGTLCGALTTCGVTLCSVRLGTPILFLPVTGMLMGYLSGLPNALYIPAFFIMEVLSGAVLDSSTELARVAVEMVLGCTLYALCSHLELFRFIGGADENDADQTAADRFIGGALHELAQETTAVMQRLTVPEPASFACRLRQQVCTGCSNYDTCWRIRAEHTEHAFNKLRHMTRNRPVPQMLDHCLRKPRLLEAAEMRLRTDALEHMQRVHLMQDRAVTLEYLQLLECVFIDRFAEKRDTICKAESEILLRILKRLSVQAEAAYVQRLQSGRYAAEIYTGNDAVPAEAITELLREKLRTPLQCTVMQSKENGVRVCIYEPPVYTMQFACKSITSPGYERCGDHADGFTDGTGNSYLILSDGMGSGSAASLASQIAVRTLRRMICSGMAPETAIRIVNTLLLTETNTENFATLDVCMLDGDSGCLTLYKAGAAATLLCRRTKVHRIISKSFPVGIVPDAETSVRQLYGLDGDCLVMLSDGISEGEYPYIRQLLQQGIPLEQLTEKVCEKAALFTGGTVRDDMTIIAARIAAQNSSHSTKNDRETAYQNRQIAVAAAK